MLFKSATTFAKLRAGFLLQYSTTNSSENFNKYVKGFLSKPLPADRLLDKVVKICQDAINQCWYAALDKSQTVKMPAIPCDPSFKKRVNAFRAIGLGSCELLAMDIPLKVAKILHLSECHNHDSPAGLHILEDSDDQYKIDVGYGEEHVFVHFDAEKESLLCSDCGSTLPAYICSHLIYCLTEMNAVRRILFWNFMMISKKGNRAISKKEPKPPSTSGLKLCDRRGGRGSANNDVRLYAEYSDPSYFQDTTNNADDVISEDEAEVPAGSTSSRGSTFSKRRSEAMSEESEKSENSSLSYKKVQNKPEQSHGRRPKRKINTRSQKRFSPSPSPVRPRKSMILQPLLKNSPVSTQIEVCDSKMSSDDEDEYTRNMDGGEQYDSTVSTDSETRDPVEIDSDSE